MDVEEIYLKLLGLELGDKSIFSPDTKTRIINMLVRQDMEAIRDDMSSLEYILRKGCTGYENEADIELIDLYLTQLYEVDEKLDVAVKAEMTRHLNDAIEGALLEE